MLRAISDTAVAIKVASVREKFSWDGQLAGLLARLDDVRVAVDADPDVSRPRSCLVPEAVG